MKPSFDPDRLDPDDWDRYFTGQEADDADNLVRQYARLARQEGLASSAPRRTVTTESFSEIIDTWPSRYFAAAIIACFFGAPVELLVYPPMAVMAPYVLAPVFLLAAFLVWAWQTIRTWARVLPYKALASAIYPLL